MARMPIQRQNDLGVASEDGVGLSLSGGGYRAMMFHVGVLYRLNEVGLLGKLTRISSVSGGSITAAYLGLLWDRLQFNNGKTANFGLFVDGMRTMANVTVDADAVIGGILFPGSISDKVAHDYDKVLFKGARLSDLPDDSGEKLRALSSTRPTFNPRCYGVFPGPIWAIIASAWSTIPTWRFARRWQRRRHFRRSFRR